MSSRPDDTTDPAGGQTEAGETYTVDARGSMGIQVGEGNTQLVYTYNMRTWTDALAPPLLASVSGVVASPYRGLGAFNEQDAAFFFGRERATGEVLERMSQLSQGRGLLVVSGASGAGKSSLLRAGVLPRLRLGGLASAPEAASWPCLVLTPGRRPLDELAVTMAVLARADTAAIRRELAADPGQLALLARQAALAEAPTLGRRPRAAATEWQEPTEQRLLLIVDQFEQVFTQCGDEEERRAFISALAAAASTGQNAGGSPAALVVLGVRADFEAHCADYPELAAAVQDRYLVTPMSERQLRIAITEPARVAGSRVDDALVAALLAEVRAHQPGTTRAGVLPLLSHALDQAWRSRTGEILTLEDYDRTGGVEGAVAATAQHSYSRLTPSQQEAARQVFTRLTATSADGRDTTDRSTRAELTQGKSVTEAADVEAVLEAFASERLLTLAADSVEISHEVLLTAWPLLRDVWLAETHSDRVVRTRLRHVAAEWVASGRDPAYLYRGSLLASANAVATRTGADRRHPPLSQAERDFLRASARARRPVSAFPAAVLACVRAVIRVLLTLYRGAISVRKNGDGRKGSGKAKVAPPRQGGPRKPPPSPEPRLRKSTTLLYGFTDGLGATFDIFGATRRVSPAKADFESELARDAHARIVALGLLPEDEIADGGPEE